MEERLNNLMLQLEGKERIQDHQTQEMFQIYNIIFPDIKEFGVSCSSCRERVYNTLRNHWIKTKNK